MSKVYTLAFGSGDPRTNTGLSPTFLIFANPLTGQTFLPPGITEGLMGSGLYAFQYGPTAPITFLVDGGAALASTDRYIKGSLDPIQSVDEKVGTLTDSFGSTSIDPASVIGYLKRIQEWLEGNSIYTKNSGIWDVYARGGTLLLAEKTLTNTSSVANKT